jgi:hypothetical protein
LGTSCIDALFHVPVLLGRRLATLDQLADEAIRGITSYAKSIGDGRVAHFGASFGGNFSAMSGLTGIVDTAIDLGGPVAESFHPEHLANLPYGILSNAMAWDHSPTLDELSKGLGRLSRRESSAQQSNSALLVINGADDYYIPQSDTLVFLMIDWLRRQFATVSPERLGCELSRSAPLGPQVAQTPDNCALTARDGSSAGSCRHDCVGRRYLFISDLAELFRICRPTVPRTLQRQPLRKRVESLRNPEEQDRP